MASSANVAVRFVAVKSAKFTPSKLVGTNIYDNQNV